MMTKLSFITMGWQQASESCLTNQIQVRSTNICWIFGKKEVTTPSQCLLSPPFLTYESVSLSVAQRDTLHVRMKDGSEAASHGERRGDKAGESLCGSGLGEPKVQFRLHRRASASSLCDPDLHNHQTRPSSEPCISVRWGYLDLLSACCLCDGF